jgi:type I restriction enzyme S subunit
MNFALNSRRSVQTLRELATGTTSVAAIYSRDLFQLLLTVPTKEEQIAIAEVLSDVDGLIAGLEALIAKKRDLKTATMQQLLTGKTRLPGFGGAWNRTKIGSHIDLLTGFPFPSAKYSDDGVRLLRGSNIKREVLDWNPRLVQFWPTVSAELQKYLLAEGDIVIAMDGSLVGRSFAVMSKPDLPALLLQRVARIRSKDIEQKYLRHWVCSQFFTSHCDEVKTVTAIPHISPEDIRSFEIHLPPTKDEQLEIANVIDDLIAEGALLADKLQKAKALKQGMMQELLTGRTRLI